MPGCQQLLNKYFLWMTTTTKKINALKAFSDCQPLYLLQKKKTKI
jgi:hypothetical protein